MNVHIPSNSKICSFNDSDEDDNNQNKSQHSISDRLQKINNNNNQTSTQIQNILQFQKTNPNLNTKIQQKQLKRNDKFTVNQIHKGFFVYDYDMVEDYKEIASSNQQKQQKKLIKSSIKVESIEQNKYQLIKAKSSSKLEQQMKLIDQQVSQRQVGMIRQKFKPQNMKLFKIDISSSQQEDQQQSQQKQQLEQQQKSGRQSQQRQKLQSEQQPQVSYKIQQKPAEQPDEQASQQKGNKQSLRKLQNLFPKFKVLPFLSLAKVQKQKLVYKPIMEQVRVKATIIRNRSGFNMLWPEYQLKIDGHRLLLAKKIPMNMCATYKFWGKDDDGKEVLVGLMQSNFLGTQHKISYTQNNGLSFILQGQITFQTQVISRCPRFFQISYMTYPRPQSCLSTLQSTLFSPQTIQFQTRRPIFIPRIGGFMLNFNQRISLPSVKNMILQDKETKQEVLMFGKWADDQFCIQITKPLNLIMAIAIALTQFQSKLIQ